MSEMSDGLIPKDSKRTRFKTADIIDALEAARGGVQLAAEALGCNPKTIERRAETSPAVHEAIHKFRRRRNEIAELKLETAILNGEPWAIQFQLRTQGKHLGYVERQEVSGADGGAIIIEWDDTDS